MPDDRPPIPAPIKRQVRQRCGFGCVICGLPLYEYDHLVPWSEVEEHDPDNIVLLCDQHHREKTNGLLPIEQVLAANEAPANLATGVSTPYDLHYDGNSCEAMIGSNIHEWPKIHDGLLTIPVLIDDTPIIMFRVEDEHLLLTVQLFDEENALIVQVVDNELVFSAEEWDVEFQGRTLIVRSTPRNIFVRITFEPPGRVTIDRARIWRNGIAMEIHPDRIIAGSGTTMMRNRAVNCVLGISSGKVPPGIGGGAIYVGSPRAEEVPIALTEDRVMRIGATPTAAPSDEAEQIIGEFKDFLDQVDPDEFQLGDE
jgi:HNH endonuclease